MEAQLWNLTLNWAPSAQGQGDGLDWCEGGLLQALHVNSVNFS